ncbi:peptide-methionine (S)-S-oxide reductase MsrA [Porticoccaceae bacterium]|nr:peptide-methionine (S)-S-oxide reductase MsrA [Porticoccaceae bacterium]MDA8682742.1 peptide-methionine (S)-S-oxide reductase MsrA [Porticoccaceae bacterium]MDB2634942.1 peptide-methionine (S)-S-oxide reductase MsrA [Porticoccaceae bacterium]MDB2664332.1 peptide-methionine (S)-S-oxide reductase MsrA [Porticoccaceae bacterium]
MVLFKNRVEIPNKEQCLPGRSSPMPVAKNHLVTGQPLQGPFASDVELAYFAMGCFWGAERRFWEQVGVVSTAVGYAGGYTPNPTYEETCTGLTGHTEVVQVAFDRRRTTYTNLLNVFWESHNPTQGMRQGNDQGTQYRSAVYYLGDEQRKIVEASIEKVQQQLDLMSLGSITTEVKLAPTFYYAEDYHQQYLIKNPDGYCGLKGTGIACA